MVANGFSQLPVLKRVSSPVRDKDIEGVVTWESIGKRIIKPRFDTTVPVRQYCTDRLAIAVCLEHEYIKDVVERMQTEYVLVLNSRREVVCMVTHSDLAHLYLKIFKPYSEIETIENAIREVLGCLKVTQLRTAARDKSRAMKISCLADLEVGEYIALFSRYWERIGIGCDRRVFLDLLEKMRTIRNSVMHFKPEGVSAKDRQVLSVLRKLLISE